LRAGNAESPGSGGASPYLDHCGEKFFYCKNFVSKSWVGNPDRSQMRLVGKLDDPVSNESKVIAKLCRLAAGAFDARMGGQAGKNELLNRFDP
jgi:hypothetical protein